ncbi:DUF4367 domain-containing protein [Flintibacter sp. KGMB00164]|uniref:DUF4367 domain-containing protein n=1 Tax=Flintibacter sp. KGMB00164 TaxID=2610895 RepID=UPI00124529FA|nr:DUF4367 domain-containing protein [Flintibacter sp. KGMB00164]
MNEKLDRLLEQYSAAAGERWLEESLPEDIPEYTFSHKFQRNMNKLLRRQRRSPAVRAALTYAKRAAIFVLAFVALSFSVRMTVDAAFRRQVLQVVVQVFSDFTEFRYTSDVKTDEQPGELEFTYLPEGMIEKEHEEDEFGYYTYWYWEDTDGRFLELERWDITEDVSSTQLLDTENAEITHFQVHGEEAMGIEKGLDHTIHWTEGQFVYTLSGTVPMEELKLVAEGIRPVSEPKVGEIEFSYLPEGVVERKEYREADDLHAYFYFEDENGNMLALEQVRITTNTEDRYFLDTEDADVFEYTIHGAPAIGVEKGQGKIIHWTEWNFVYTLSGTIPMEELKLVAEGIRPVSESKVGKIKFGYLPEGMEIAETELGERDYFVWYKDSDGRFITLDQSLIEGNDELIWMLDTEDAEVTKFKVHNFDAIGIQKGADCTIHWTEGEIVYVLLGRNLPMEELKLVAEGIK